MNSELPQYKCHKVVRAAKILDIALIAPPPPPEDSVNGGQSYYPAELTLAGVPAAVHVNESWMGKHQPQIGGYFVQYDDGYFSYSPAAAFESGYTKLNPSTPGMANPLTSVEQEIQDKGLTAPRVTPADIEAAIASEHYFTANDGVQGTAPSLDTYRETGECYLHPQLTLLTFCVLVLRNGFTVTGESACASPENFDADLGRKIARQNAVSKMWPLLGYALRSKLAEAQP